LGQVHEWLSAGVLLLHEDMICKNATLAPLISIEVYRMPGRTNTYTMMLKSLPL